MFRLLDVGSSIGRRAHLDPTHTIFYLIRYPPIFSNRKNRDDSPVVFLGHVGNDRYHLFFELQKPIFEDVFVGRFAAFRPRVKANECASKSEWGTLFAVGLPRPNDQPSHLYRSPLCFRPQNFFAVSATLDVMNAIPVFLFFFVLFFVSRLSESKSYSSSGSEYETFVWHIFRSVCIWLVWYSHISLLWKPLSAGKYSTPLIIGDLVRLINLKSHPTSTSHVIHHSDVVLQ